MPPKKKQTPTRRKFPSMEDAAIAAIERAADKLLDARAAHSRARKRVKQHEAADEDRAEAALLKAMDANGKTVYKRPLANGYTLEVKSQSGSRKALCRKFKTKKSG